MNESMDIKYLAGLIDGEGCIQIYGKGFCKVRLTIANTYEPLIDLLKSSFGGCKWQYCDERTYKGRYRKPVYFWTLTTKKAEELLRKCYPYLIIKKDQASLIFSIRMSISTKYWKVSKEVLENRKRLCKQLSELNKKGSALQSRP